MLADSGDEEESNAIVGKILDEIGIEMSEKVRQLLNAQIQLAWLFSALM